MLERQTLSARLEAFRARTVQGRRLGCDCFAAARLAAEMAGRTAGPALDVGTGSAVMASTLAAIQGNTVFTVDSDDSERDLAEIVVFETRVRDRVVFMRADAARLPFTDGYFGCAFMMDALCDVQDAAGVLREMARVVSGGAPLVVADFTAEGRAAVGRLLHVEGNERCLDGLAVGDAVKLAGKLGLRLVMRAEGFLHEVAVFRKGDGGRRGSFPV